MATMSSVVRQAAVVAVMDEQVCLVTSRSGAALGGAKKGLPGTRQIPR